MNNIQYNDFRMDLVEILLACLEGRRTIKEVLVQSNELCQKNISDIFVLKASKRLATLAKNYNQGKITEDEAKDEIANIEILIT